MSRTMARLQTQHHLHSLLPPPLLPPSLLPPSLLPLPPLPPPPLLSLVLPRFPRTMSWALSRPLQCLLIILPVSPARSPRTLTKLPASPACTPSPLPPSALVVPRRLRHQQPRMIPRSI